MLQSSSGLSKGLKTRDRSPFSSPYSNLAASPIAARRSSAEERRRPAANFKSALSPAPADRIDEEEGEGDGDGDGDGREAEGGDQDEDVDDDEAGELSPLLPIFSAAHLGTPYLPFGGLTALLIPNADALPVYNLTHTIRLLVVARCETTLSWDQLRSPQVSQFLVKPVQQQIRSSHFSKATLYALLANCLQFNKEVTMAPGNSGTSKTRALVCELLAIKLLREFTTRELVRHSSVQFCTISSLHSIDRYFPLSSLNVLLD